MITAADLQAGLKMYNVTLREGDIVIIHTGWGDLFEQFPAQNALYNCGEPGIGKEAANWLISQKVVAVGADTWAVEVIPGENPKEAFLVHQMLLTDNGIHIIENVRTDLIAADGRQHQPRHVLLHDDRAEGRRHDRQLRRDRRHPLTGAWQGDRQVRRSSGRRTWLTVTAALGSVRPAVPEGATGKTGAMDQRSG